MTTEYATLKTNFSSKGFKFTMLKREKNKAIFLKSKADGVKSYEVIMIGKHNGYTLAGNFIPPAEIYPGTNNWGNRGFTFTSLEAAEAKFKKLK